MKKGYLITECSHDLEINEDGKDGKSLYITGIFSSYGLRNNNGRVYEEKTMKREVNKILEKIGKSSLWGELGHPPCVLGDTEILTNNGWKQIQDIDDDEIVATLNPDTRLIEYNQITKKVINPFNGKMVRFKNRQIDIAFTPDHRHLLFDKYDKPYFETTDNIKNSETLKIRKSYIPKTGIWLSSEQDDSTITLKGLDSVSSSNYNHSVDVVVDLMTYVRFFGIWLAEGNVTKNNRNRVTIYQNEGPTADMIREMLSGFPEEMEWGETNDNGKISFSLSDGRLAQHLKPLGTCYTKYIPESVKCLGIEYLEELLYWFGLGDGRGFLNNDTKKDIFSVSEKLVDDFHEVAFKCGMSARKTVSHCTNDYIFAGRVIESINKSPLYHLKIYTTSRIYTDDRFMGFEEEEYEGLVYCVQVPNQNFYIRNNDSVSFFTGNCPEVNMDKIAIKLESLEWQGKDLYGKAKILDTPMGNIAKTLVREGNIGISSRGLGTVAEDGTVNEDYNLLTWDLVTDPSNNPSWVKGIYESKTWDMGDRFGEAVVEQEEETISEQYAKNEYYKYILENIRKIEKNL
jgi:hypothetical protein